MSRNPPAHGAGPAGIGPASAGAGLACTGSAGAGLACTGSAGAGPAGSGPAGAEAMAREICLKLLTAAPRTRAQLAGALRRRGVPQDAADQVLGRFTDVGLIDDATFAAAWVDSRHHSRGLSRRALAAELRQRGVGDPEVRDAIAGLDPEREAATARRLADRRLAASRGQPAPVRARRVVATLARKGYPPAMAFRIAREALEQEGIDPDGAGLDESAEAGAQESSEFGPGDPADTGWSGQDLT